MKKILQINIEYNKESVDKFNQIKTSSSGGISSSSFMDFLISPNQFLVLLNILYYQSLYLSSFLNKLSVHNILARKKMPYR